MCVCVCVCVCMYAVLYKCLSLWSVEYCTGLFVWGLEFCAHLVVGRLCVTEVRGGGSRCWALCVFVIKSLRRLRVFSVVVMLESGNGQFFTIHIYALNY